MRGHIKLHRAITEHWIWDNPRFLKWWIDLLFMVNYKDVKKLVNGNLITYKRGEINTSALRLSQRWNVDRKTIMGFLSVLEKDGMILVSKSRQTGTTVKVLNYEHFQGVSDNDCNNELDNGINNDCNNELDNGGNNELDISKERNKKGIRKNKKGVRKDKENIPLSPLAFIQEQDFTETLGNKVIEWVGYKKERREAYKDIGLKSLCTQIKNKVANYGEQAVCDLITECMSNGWKGIIWDKLKRGEVNGVHRADHASGAGRTEETEGERLNRIALERMREDGKGFQDTKCEF